MTAPAQPKPGPLAVEDVKLLREGDWLIKGHNARPVADVVRGRQVWVWGCEGKNQMLIENIEQYSFGGRPGPDGWIKHEGGDKPDFGSLKVQIKRRCGLVETWADHHQSHYWLHDGDPLDIIAWRPAVQSPAGGGDAPVPVSISCPKCDVPHIDEGEWATTRHHKTHQCQGCGHEWRPFPFATVGVAPPVAPEPDDGAVSKLVDDEWRALCGDGPDSFAIPAVIDHAEFRAAILSVNASLLATIDTLTAIVRADGEIEKVARYAINFIADLDNPLTTDWHVAAASGPLAKRLFADLDRLAARKQGGEGC